MFIFFFPSYFTLCIFLTGVSITFRRIVLNRDMEKTQFFLLQALGAEVLHKNAKHARNYFFIEILI